MNRSESTKSVVLELACQRTSPPSTEDAVNPITQSDALRKLSLVLRRFIRTYESELASALSSTSRAESSFTLVDTQIEGSRYLIVKVPVASRSLTSRQLEIALFVAEGFSNREVAERLSISQATVASHLRVVYEKLNIQSRTAILPALLDRDGKRHPEGTAALAPPGGSVRQRPNGSSGDVKVR